MKFSILPKLIASFLVLLLGTGSASLADEYAVSEARPPTTATLFATARSPGAVAVGAAEGNLTPTGEVNSIYYGHIDPGNHVTNRGFCSWNHAANLTVAEADRHCLAALQQQSAATEHQMKALGLDPAIHTTAIVNGTDLWNQSNQAGPQFPAKYKQALNRGLSDRAALIDARVEAFRNSAGALDASGLFGICASQPYYQNRLASLTPYSETWRWQCIALDQGRRVREVASALGQVVEGAREAGGAREIPSSQPFASVALNFDPVAPAPVIPIQRAVRRRVASGKGTAGGQLDFRVSLVGSAVTHGSVVPAVRSPVVLDFAPVTAPGAMSFLKQPPGQAEMTPLLTRPSSVILHPTLGSGTPQLGDRIAGYIVTSPYGPRLHPLTGHIDFHGGVDLNTPIHTNLYAIGPPGTISHLRCWTDAQGGGLVATMTSPSFPNLQFDALHLFACQAPIDGPEIEIRPGEIVASTGSTGESTGPHLHFQIRDSLHHRHLPPPKQAIAWVLTGSNPNSELRTPNSELF